MDVDVITQLMAVYFSINRQQIMFSNKATMPIDIITFFMDYTIGGGTCVLKICAKSGTSANLCHLGIPAVHTSVSAFA